MTIAALLTVAAGPLATLGAQQPTSEVNVTESEPKANAHIGRRSSAFFVRFDRPVDHIKSMLVIKQGDKVIWHFTSLERARDATHGFCIAGYNINLSIEPGEATTIEFVADKPGVFNFYCTEFCSALHLEMAGYLMVEPKN